MISRFWGKQMQPIVEQVLRELSGSNFALELKEMIVEELEEVADKVMREHMVEIKEELISTVSDKLLVVSTGLVPILTAFNCPASSVLRSSNEGSGGGHLAVYCP